MCEFVMVCHQRGGGKGGEGRRTVEVVERRGQWGGGGGGEEEQEEVKDNKGGDYTGQTSTCTCSRAANSHDYPSEGGSGRLPAGSGRGGVSGTLSSVRTPSVRKLYKALEVS